MFLLKLNGFIAECLSGVKRSAVCLLPKIISLITMQATFKKMLRNKNKISLNIFLELQ